MKKIFLMLFVAGVTFTSCKKEGCTDATATNYDSKAKKDNGTCAYPPENPATSQLCGGISGNEKYFPLAVGYKWVYNRKLGNSTSVYSEEIVGTTTISGVQYFVVDYVNAQLADQGTFHYRVESSTGDVYKRNSSGTETLVMYGSPAVGQVIDGSSISSLNASVTTAACNYTGCLELTKSTMFGTEKTYFKKGIGYIKETTGSTGGDELVEVSF